MAATAPEGASGAGAVLHTERLVLRPVTAPSAARLLAEDGVPGLPLGPGFPRADDRAVLEGVAAAGADAADVWLVVRDGALIGTVGVTGPVSDDGDLEIGYGLVPAARGEGLATEAVGAVCAVLDHRPGVRRLLAEVLPGNEASLRLLLRLGFERLAADAPPHLVLARPVAGTVPAGRPRGRIAGRHVC